MFSIHRASMLLFVSCAALAMPLCCTGSSSSGPAGLGESGSSSEGGEGGADNFSDDAIPSSLAFTPATTVKLAPKQTRVLSLITTPPGVFRVRFALLGASADAVLEANDVQSGADGSARVTLTASSTPTSFSVRAAVVGKLKSPQTLVGVSVSALGYTSLSVKPSYSGRRTVTQWTASVHAGDPCSKLKGSPPPDGDLLTLGDFGEPLVIPEVPIGIGLAVTLRAGHYIGGCADLAALSEGDGNQVLVYASDRAVNFDDTRLDLSFGPSDVRPDFSKLMKAAESQTVASLLGTAANDVASLLDAMHEATPVLERDAFASTRIVQHWDSALASAFGSNAMTRMREPADRWMSAGLSAFNAPNCFVGQLSPSPKAAAQFDLATVALQSPVDAGFSTTAASTWSADTSDTLLLGTELHWVPSRLMTALAVPPALLEFPSASNAPTALAQSVDCALVAKTLLAHGATPGAAVYPACDESCALSACVAAISALWNTAREASGGALAVLGVTAAGMAQVGDDAQLVSAHGSWLGTLTQGDASAAASGALVARAPVN